MSPEPASRGRWGRDGALNIAGAVCQQASLLAVTALISRTLGQQALGRYVLAYATLALLSLVSMVGFRAALNRFVAGHLADGEPERIWSLTRFAVATTGTIAVALGAVLVVAAEPLATVFGDPGLRTGFVVVGLTLPAVTLRDVCLAATQGWRTQRAFALVGWVVEPLARLALTGVLLAAGLGVDGALAALLVAAWLAAGLAAWSLWRLLARSTAGRPAGTPLRRTTVDARAVLGFAVVTWGTTLAATGLIWADTLLLGALGTSAAVGTYTVATRLVSLAVFVMAPVDALFAPYFARFAHVGDRVGLGGAYTAATTWTLRLSLPAFVVVVVFAEPLLALFGPGFATGATVTVVLACGQLVNAATGPAGSLLVMAGSARTNLVDNAAGLALNIALNVALIPRFGIVGAAVAWSASLTALNLTKAVQAHALLGVWPVARLTLRPAAAAAVAAAVAVLLRAVGATSSPTAVAAALAVGLVYGLASLLLGFSDDECETARGVLRRAPALT